MRLVLSIEPVAGIRYRANPDTRPFHADRYVPTILPELPLHPPCSMPTEASSWSTRTQPSDWMLPERQQGAPVR